MDGVLQIEGSEDFVSQQIARLEPHIIRAFESRDSNSPKVVKATNKTGAIDGQITEINAYEQLFAQNGDKIQILKNIPGSNNAQKTVNIALLLAYANKLLGVDVISSDLVRDACKSHACFDSGNFASYLKKAKALFLLEGGPNTSKNIRLTVPGKTKAEDLAKQLNAQ